MSQDLLFWAELQVVPLQAIPSQTLQITLGGQSCQLNVYAKQIQVPIQPPGRMQPQPPVYMPTNPVFTDVLVGGTLIIGGVLGRQGVRIVRDAYLGFTGDLVWYDTQPGPDGPTDPIYTGLGGRYLLTYWPFLPGYAG